MISELFSHPHFLQDSSKHFTELFLERFLFSKKWVNLYFDKPNKQTYLVPTHVPFILLRLLFPLLAVIMEFFFYL